jgi:hypothetical protein
VGEDREGGEVVGRNPFRAARATGSAATVSLKDESARIGNHEKGTWNMQYIPLVKETGEELEHYIDQYGGKLSAFGPISRINILVGATNSGKSRFMRGLIKTSTEKLLSLPPDAPDPNRALSACWRLARTDFHVQIIINPNSREYDPETHPLHSAWLAQQLASLRTAGPQTHHLTKHDFSKVLNWLRPGLAGAVEQREHLRQFMLKFRLVLQASDSSQADREWFNLAGNELDESTKEDIKLVADFIESLCPSDVTTQTACYSSISPRKIYVPVFRTAVQLKRVSTQDTVDCLAQTIGANYGLDSEKVKAEVFTGNLLYFVVQRERSRDPETHKRLKDFERFLGKTFFEGMTIELVPLDETYTPGRHLALFIDEQIQRPFHDIGDGIQAIIILLYRLFTAEPGTWIFIEEPEQGLHPGLQRIFLEALARDPVLQEKDLTVFMSTHSNHLLGMALSELEDVTAFAFQRWADPEQFEIRPIHTRQPNLLTLLGVANSSVFLANCGIWVEGITDRKYLRAYLSAYLLSEEFESEHSFVPQEDVHYAFFEYAGSNLAHYLFEPEDSASSDLVEQIRAQFLCNRIFLLADQDKGKEEKHKRNRAAESESFRYYVTPGIEVENLISETELSQALPQLISGLTKEAVAKAKIQFSDYRGKHIGLYLKETFGDLCPDALKAASGTLSSYYKDKLASVVCPNVTWENMSEDARRLAKALYGFIYKHNQVAPNLGIGKPQKQIAGVEENSR